ncbi:MAG: alpha/beta fold hydrolase [Solirubrobacteraceae bacterium]
MATEVKLGNGVTLAYDEAGERGRRPLVLVHGVSMSRRYFREQLGPLSGELHVVAVDLRAHGDSEKVQSGHTIAQYGRDLGLFLDALGVKRPVLLGWSMGAFVIWDYIRQFGSEALDGLIVVDEAASDFKWDGFPHGFIDLETLRTMLVDVQDDRLAFLRHLVPLMFNAQPSHADLESLVGECAKLPIGPLTAILFDQSVQDYRDLVATLDLPTLICWGRHDGLVGLPGAHDLLERMPNARLEVFDDSGHCPFLEQPAAFNEVVASFARELGERVPR